MLKVIYEDNHVIVIVKPYNIPSQADKTGDEDMITLVKKYLKEKYQKPGDVYLGLVHRLDRPVGGLMVFAKTSKAASRLSDSIRTNNFKKTYLAVVNGILEEKKGVLENYLWKDEVINKSKVVDKGKRGSKFARLSYEVINEEAHAEDVIYQTIASTLGKKYEVIYYVNLDDDKYVEFNVTGAFRHLPIDTSG